MINFKLVNRKKEKSSKNFKEVVRFELRFERRRGFGDVKVGNSTSSRAMRV